MIKIAGGILMAVLVLALLLLVLALLPLIIRISLAAALAALAVLAFGAAAAAGLSLHMSALEFTAAFSVVMLPIYLLWVRYRWPPLPPRQESGDQGKQKEA